MTMNNENKTIIYRIALILLFFSFVSEVFGHSSQLKSVYAAPNNNVKQVKKLSLYIRRNGEKDSGKKKFLIKWDDADITGYAVRIYRKTPSRLTFTL